MSFLKHFCDFSKFFGFFISKRLLNISLICTVMQSSTNSIKPCKDFQEKSFISFFNYRHLNFLHKKTHKISKNFLSSILKDLHNLYFLVPINLVFYGLHFGIKYLVKSFDIKVELGGGLKGFEPPYIIKGDRCVEHNLLFLMMSHERYFVVK